MADQLSQVIELKMREFSDITGIDPHVTRTPGEAANYMAGYAKAIKDATKVADDKLREINARGTWDDKDRHTNDGAAAAAQEIGNEVRALTHFKF